MKRIHIVFKLNTNKRHAKLTKFRIKIIKKLKEAKILDTENINDLQRKTEEKWLNNIRIVSQLLDENSLTPVGSKKIKYYIIYDVKMNLTRQARLVVEGKLKDEVSAYISCLSIVEKDSVRIGFKIAAMNDQLLSMQKMRR